MISVIIPVYNGEKYVYRCIKSAIRALENITAEIIVVNDGSTDNTQTIIENIKGITIIEQKNQGLDKTRENGFKMSKGNYIHFLDCDDIVSECFYKEFELLNGKNYILNKTIDFNDFGTIKNKLYKNISGKIETYKYAPWNRIIPREAVAQWNFKNELELAAYLLKNYTAIYGSAHLKYRVHDNSMTSIQMKKGYVPDTFLENHIEIYANKNIDIDYFSTMNLGNVFLALLSEDDRLWEFFSSKLRQKSKYKPSIKFRVMRWIVKGKHKTLFKLIKKYGGNRNG